MAQHDMNIANASGAVVRADINDAFEAIATQNSGSTAPSTTFAHQWWMDESTNILKIRNAANTAWINVATKSGSTWTLVGAILTGSHTIPLPAAALAPATTSGCGILATLEMATNDVDVDYLPFDASTQEYAHFQFRAPKSVDETTGIYVTPSWMHPSTTTNFGVVWGVQLLARSNGDALDAAWGTEQTSADTGGSTNTLYVGPETAAITPGGTWAEGDWLFGRIYRKVSDGSDTLAVDARLLGIDLRVTYTGGNDD